MRWQHSFKHWLRLREEFGQGQGPTGAVGVGGSGMLVKGRRKVRLSNVVLPRELQQDRHTADRVDPG